MNNKTQIDQANTLPLVKQLVLDITTDDDKDIVLSVYDKIQFYKTAIREISKHLDDALIEWMNENGDIQVDERRRLYVGNTKKTTCNDKGKLLEALYEVAGGDVEKVVECFAAGAFKPGACKTVLGGIWCKHFTITDVEDVKTGVAKKSVKLLDERFVRTPTSKG